MFVHGNNLEQKENHTTKYRDADSKRYLAEIRIKYNQWKADNEQLKGPFSKNLKTDSTTLEKRVELLFRAPSYKEMIKMPHAMIEKKDHDFVIGTSVKASMTCSGSDVPELHEWDIPAVAIECKTYLDKTMLQDVSTAAEQLKLKNPNAMYIVVAEWLKLTDSVNLKKYKIDQIYILRKQKNTDREFRYGAAYVKNPIYFDVVEHCFNTVRQFLTTDWEGGIAHGLEKGFLI